ncbi:MAG: hypothetical protein LBH76_09965, partial [Propionibacteriaceae bacterium]|nr:hypothetical protein [Propionibacteriaceae bacterium]
AAEPPQVRATASQPGTYVLTAVDQQGRQVETNLTFLAAGAADTGAAVNPWLIAAGAATLLIGLAGLVGALVRQRRESSGQRAV